LLNALERHVITPGCMIPGEVGERQAASRLSAASRGAARGVILPLDEPGVVFAEHTGPARDETQVRRVKAQRCHDLRADLLPALSSDDRLPGGTRLRFSVEVGSAADFEASPLQLRGVVKNALVEALASRGVASDVDGDAPDVVFIARRAGTPDARRTVVGIDVGGGARHRRGARVAAGLDGRRLQCRRRLVQR
jgi:hypothetical protein